MRLCVLPHGQFWPERNHSGHNPIAVYSRTPCGRGVSQPSAEWLAGGGGHAGVLQAGNFDICGIHHHDPQSARKVAACFAFASIRARTTPSML